MTASSISKLLLPGAGAATRSDPEEAAERALVSRVRGGCTEAFRELVECYQHPVHRFCFHYLRDDGEALEACQDTFVRAHGAIGRYQPRARLSTWLFRIALNLCHDRIRRRRPTVPLDDLDFACRGPAPDEAAIRDADLAKLDRGLAALPVRLRDVVVLSCLDGLSHAECAAVLRCSERAVEGRLYRARRQLAAWWEADPA